MISRAEIFHNARRHIEPIQGPCFRIAPFMKAKTRSETRSTRPRLRSAKQYGDLPTAYTMSEQTLDLLELIRQRLKVATRRIQQAELAHGLALTLGILASIWLILTAIEAGFWLETTSRSLLFWAVLLLTTGLTGYFLVMPLLRFFGILPGPSEEHIAALIGHRYPDVSDRLVNMLHLAKGRRSEAPDVFVDRAVRMLGEQVRSVPFEQVEDFGRVRRIGRYAGVPVAGLLIFLLAAPGTFLDASERLLSPGTYFERPAPFSLSVQPGNTQLVKGDPLEVTIRAAGQAPRSLTLFINNLDEDLVEEVQLMADSTGTFRHTLANVRKPMRYAVAAAPVRTPWYEVGVTERPLVRGLQVSLEFPRYTRIPARELEPNVGDVSALAGTRVSVDVAVGGAGAAEAFLEFDDGTRDTLSIEENRATGSFVLRKDGAYKVILRNAHGVENDTPITYTLTALRDGSPSIALLEPDSDAVLTEALQMPLHARIRDDFGFSRLHLYYRLAESRFGTPSETFETLPLPLQNPSQLDQDVVYEWLLSQTTELDPVPGDVIEYYVQVWDNDTFAGPKSARTETYRLRLPSLSEQYQELEKQQDDTQDELENLLEETQAIRDQFQNLRNELRSKQESDWQDQRQLQQLQEQQKNLEERVEALSEQVESVMQQMQENNLVSEQTLRQYQELQKVIEEINSPELQEALRQLQEAMQQLNLQQLQESLGKFEFNEQQYRERLERTLELFKKLRMQQNLDEASRRAEELAERQRELAKETGKLLGETEPAEDRSKPNDAPEPEGGEENGESPERRDEAGQEQGTPEQTDERQGEANQNQNQPRERLADEQERSSQEMQELERELEEMVRKMEELRNGPKQEMQELNEQVRQQELSRRMQQNAQQLQQNQLQQARSGQQQMQQQLQQLQQQLQQMQQNMQGQQQQVNMAGLRRALDNVLTLSKDQEDLHANVRSLTGEAPQVRDLARRQTELSEAMRVVSDSLQRLSRDIPQMSRGVQQQAGDAIRAMHAATEAMAERMAPQASAHQQASMMHLNELALLLSDLMNQLMNQSSGGEGMSMQQMQQQLQQMAGQQQKLNEQIQQMLNEMQGNRLSSDMQQRLRQMAAQQRAIQEQLKQLNRDPNARGKLLGDLNKVADQMEETIRELQRNQLDRPLIERQQQILTRLLDAQKSLQERGREKEREGRRGKDVNRESPADLPREEQIEKLRRDLLRALETGYAPDYEELIKRYFDLLQNQNQPQNESN